MRRFSTVVPMLMLGVLMLALILGGPRALREYALAEQAARIVLARDELAQDDILQRLDRAVAAIHDAVTPSVVHLETIGSQRGLGGSSGAGWVYDREGHIVTNAHVVRNAGQISAEFSDGVVVEARLVGSDVYTDIAVLRVDRAGDELVPIRRSTTRLPRVGERVFAFGSPFGFKFSMSEGIVSGLGRETPGSSIPGGYTNYIQTDAAVNPGNSGGPLVNTDGHVMGMNVAIATARSVGATPEDSGDSAGISFAIPLGTIEPIVQQIIKYGSVSRGFMGITYGGQGTGTERVLTADGRLLTGVKVSEVVEGGPSDRAGVRVGDVIVSVRGSPVLSDEALGSLVSSGRPGDEMPVTVWRDGGLVDVTVVLAPIEARVMGQRLAQPTQIRLGMILRVPREGEAGVVVAQLWDQGPAAVGGLRPDDQIVRVAGKAFAGWYEFFVACADAGLLTGNAVTFGVIDAEGESRDVTVRITP